MSYPYDIATTSLLAIPGLDPDRFTTETPSRSLHVRGCARGPAALTEAGDRLILCTCTVWRADEPIDRSDPWAAVVRAVAHADAVASRLAQLEQAVTRDPTHLPVFRWRQLARTTYTLVAHDLTGRTDTPSLLDTVETVSHAVTAVRNSWPQPQADVFAEAAGQVSDRVASLVARFDPVRAAWPLEYLWTTLHEPADCHGDTLVVMARHQIDEIERDVPDDLGVLFANALHTSVELARLKDASVDAFDLFALVVPRYAALAMADLLGWALPHPGAVSAQEAQMLLSVLRQAGRSAGTSREIGDALTSVRAALEATG